MPSRASDEAKYGPSSTRPKKKPKPSGGGRTPGEVAFGQSQQAAGHEVSPSNLNVASGYSQPSYSSPSSVPGVSANTPREIPHSLSAQLVALASDGRSNLALPGKDIVSALEQIRTADVPRPQISETGPKTKPIVDPKLVEEALLTLAPAVVMKKTDRGRVVTGLRVKGAKPGKTTTRAVFGQPTVNQISNAAESGKLKVTNNGRLATVPQVRASQKLKGARERFVKAKRKAKGAPRRELISAGLTPEQANVLATVLGIGKRMGATQKELLAATETAIQESGIANLPSGDADSAGWRQERAMYYPNPTNVRASAKRYFEETAAAGRGAGQTAGQLAQSVQRSKFPDRYDERQAEATPLLEAFDRAPMKAIPRPIKRGLRRAQTQAYQLGAPGAKGGELPESGQTLARGGSGKFSYPLAVKGTIGSTPEDHGARAFGNWMSDNAVDISTPIGTPVDAVTDAVVTRISGSAPNHAANPAGWTVYLKDASGEEYSYMHLDGYSVQAGDTVKKGQRIGRSGAANGVAHLHFATKNGNPQDLIEGKATVQADPTFINFSRKGGAGTSRSKWLAPTGDETLKFQTPFARALVQLAKASGEPIKFNSGFRSTAEQQALYDAYKAGTGNLAAAPGSSNHEFGAAADVELTSKQRELAGQFGLGFPVAGEDWHIELVGDAANGIVAGVGGSSGSPASTGGLGTPGTPGAPVTPAASQQQERPIGLGNYSGGITSSNLPQAYLDLIMSAGSPGETGLLDEFLKKQSR